MKALTQKQRKWLLRILSAAGLLLAAWLVDRTVQAQAGVQAGTQAGGLVRLVTAALYLVPYGIAGWDVLYKAVRNIRNGQAFDENFLMALATVGAFAVGEYAEAVFVMVFYQIGEWFQDYAVGRSRQSIAALMDIRPDTACVVRADGTLEEIDPEDAEPGMVVLIKPGDRIPVDGVVLEGESSIDTAALTGESLPRDAGPGDSVVSGCVNQTGVLRVRVTRAGEESTVARILDLVENAGEKKAVSEQLITRFARYYTPSVVAAAAVLAVVPPLLGGHWGAWFHRALVFLVVSCPCALVISIPLSFFGGIGGASRQGILIKGSVYLEALARTEIVVFDKTGTLTQGRFTVTAVEPAPGFTAEQVLEYAALAESWSHHPLALSLRAAYGERRQGGGRDAMPDVSGVEELAGHGVRAVIAGHRVCVGNRRLMEGAVPAAAGVCVYVSVDGAYGGRIHLEDQVKPDARSALDALRRKGVIRTVLLTGDGEDAARAAARAVGAGEVYAELLPGDKVARMEALLREKRPSTAVAFVGDGLNDAPVLARADIGVAMGALGSDAAIEAADVVLMDDRIGKLASAMGIARKTMGIVRQNIVFALGVKFLVLGLAAFGSVPMWAAVFADVGVAFLAILNAMRCLRVET